METCCGRGGVNGEKKVSNKRETGSNLHQSWPSTDRAQTDLAVLDKGGIVEGSQVDTTGALQGKGENGETKTNAERECSWQARLHMGSPLTHENCNWSCDCDCD
jgi:hypothetical protein